MQMSDTRQIAATPAEVYAALLDPKMLQTCVPGAQDVTGSVEEGYDATVVQKVGPVKATFKGHDALRFGAERSADHHGRGQGRCSRFRQGRRRSAAGRKGRRHRAQLRC